MSDPLLDPSAPQAVHPAARDVADATAVDPGAVSPIAALETETETQAQAQAQAQAETETGTGTDPRAGERADAAAGAAVFAAIDEPAPARAPASAAPRAGDAFVQSFARGLAVLRSFGAEAPTQTLSAAAARSGMTRAGARRILLTLQQLGYVASEGRHFRLTPRVMDLGFAYLASQPVWHLAQPVLEELARDTHESSSAAVLDGDDVVTLLRIPARRIAAASFGPGSRLPAFCTSTGHVLLAGLAAPERRARLARAPLAARTSRSVIDVDPLLAVLDQVRQDGHALVRGEPEDGLLSMAAPIFNRAGKVVAAIEVSAPERRLSPDDMRKRLLPRLLECAAAIDALMRMQD